ncbi:LysM domain-containing protein [Candidatus Nitrospira bockiana]
MIDPMAQLQSLLQGNDGSANLFPPNSRYHGIPTAILQTPDGRAIVYLRRRFVPAPDRFVTVQEHTVVQGDRLDNLAAQYVGDAELFWRLCDANVAMRPEELTEVIARRIRITLPEGLG